LIRTIHIRAGLFQGVLIIRVVRLGKRDVCLINPYLQGDGSLGLIRGAVLITGDVPIQFNALDLHFKG